MIIILIILSELIVTSSIWPPPYKVDLKQFEEFVLDDGIESNEDEFNEEDEMIHNDDLEKHNIKIDKHKFNLIDKLAKRYNDRYNENKHYFKQFNTTNAEENDTEYYEELAPFQAGFLDKNSNFIINNENKNVYYLNSITKQLVAADLKQKREDQKETDYNYEELNKEYDIEVEKEVKLKETFNSTSIEENESVEGALETLVDFETPKNCTAEEMKGIGFGAAKCAWMDLKKADTKESRIQLFYRVKRILTVWVSVYLIIVIPLWCHKGWCCCCFRCKYCRPRDRIDECKKYYVESPPGVFIQRNGEIMNYEPTVYEIDAYFKLEKTLMSL